MWSFMSPLGTHLGAEPFLPLQSLDSMHTDNYFGSSPHPITTFAIDRGLEVGKRLVL
jgi:hypothetical protein